MHGDGAAGLKKQILISRARAVLEVLQPLAPILIAADLPADAISRFEADLRAFEATMDHESIARHRRICSNQQVEEKAREARALVRQLGAILEFRMRNAPAFLEAWQSVSHIERGPKRSGNERHTPWSGCVPAADEPNREAAQNEMLLPVTPQQPSNVLCSREEDHLREEVDGPHAEKEAGDPRNGETTRPNEADLVEEERNAFLDHTNRSYAG